MSSPVAPVPSSSSSDLDFLFFETSFSESFVSPLLLRGLPLALGSAFFFFSLSSSFSEDDPDALNFGGKPQHNKTNVGKMVVTPKLHRKHVTISSRLLLNLLEGRQH